MGNLPHHHKGVVELIWTHTWSLEDDAKSDKYKQHSETDKELSKDIANGEQ